VTSAERPEADAAEQQREVVEQAADPETGADPRGADPRGAGIVVPPDVDRLSEADQADVLDQLREEADPDDEPRG
jgi:hypothetical protein